jgi:hypothetical protein
MNPKAEVQVPTSAPDMAQPSFDHLIRELPPPEAALRQTNVQRSEKTAAQKRR